MDLKKLVSHLEISVGFFFLKLFLHGLDPGFLLNCLGKFLIISSSVYLGRPGTLFVSGAVTPMACEH